MKSSKTAGVIAILFVILLPLGAAYSQRELDYLKSMINSQPSLTVISSESRLLDAQYDEVLRQQREAKKQLILLENSADSLTSQKELAPIKTRQTLQTEEHLLQLEYFNICLLIENDKLLNSELDLLVKQTAVEQAKFAVGNSTQNNVDLLVAAQNLARQNIVANQAKIDAGKTSVSVKLVSHAINPDFIIPDYIDETFLPNDRNLQSSLLRNNLTMIEYDNAIFNQNKLLRYIDRDLGKNDAMYTEGIAELDRLMAQRELYQTQLILLAATKYSEYVVATAQYIKSVQECAIRCTCDNRNARRIIIGRKCFTACNGLP